MTINILEIPNTPNCAKVNKIILTFNSYSNNIITISKVLNPSDFATNC